jgi:hypothetical protein
MLCIYCYFLVFGIWRLIRSRIAHRKLTLLKLFLIRKKIPILQKFTSWKAETMSANLKIELIMSTSTTNSGQTLAFSASSKLRFQANKTLISLLALVFFQHEMQEKDGTFFQRKKSSEKGSWRIFRKC